MTLTLFELAKLDLVPGNPSKSGICWPTAADHCPERRGKKKKNRRLERVDAGAAWIYLTGTSGQKKKIKNAALNKNARTERCKDIKKIINS